MSDSHEDDTSLSSRLRASGIDGATLARRILAILPHLPQEADGDVWQAARAMLDMKLDNEELVRLASEAERQRRADDRAT